MDQIDFTDKVAIVTGASSGIGTETAVILASYGAQLTLVGRDETRLVKTAQRCVAQNRLVPLWLVLDLTHPGSCETVINKTVEMFGKIDVLINCAGKILLSSLHDNSMEAFDEIMNINFRVPYYLSQLALPHLIKTKGNIINIGSSMSKRFKPGFLSYIISKSALETLTKHAAPELVSEGVRINTISPGTTRTNILANFNSQNMYQQLTYEDISQDIPSGQILEPKEVAMLICLTASSVFSSVNGSELLLDGGECMA
ncbi:uncharacterized oxidoreductase SSP0419-like [Manduca sexta]|uniref:uncharacterized oxidoreductase SSP0419-like n=1 Tax=Manduca sexta TaxID=7130 RepID=UPI00188F33A3|nr:uncharacterized oxidoreductase SSP0419-like [Manduca sexta]XP_037293187.1 uncharacterized oxidoreductase SSP0419-like [Manduca sexta]